MLEGDDGKKCALGISSCPASCQPLHLASAPLCTQPLACPGPEILVYNQNPPGLSKNLYRRPILDPASMLCALFMMTVSKIMINSYSGSGMSVCFTHMVSFINNNS